MSEPMIISTNALSEVIRNVMVEAQKKGHSQDAYLLSNLIVMPDDTFHRFAELLSEAAQSRIEQTPTMIRRPGKADFSGWEGKE